LKLPVTVAVAVVNLEFQLIVRALRLEFGWCYKFQRYTLVYKLYHEGVCRRCTLVKRTFFPSDSDKRILYLVHSKEAQDLEATMMMSPTVYENSKSNGTTTTRLQVFILGLIFYIVAY
jgi:hypothetical protein